MVGLIEGIQEEPAILFQVVVGVTVVEPFQLDLKLQVDGILHLVDAHHIEQIDTEIERQRK